MLRAASLVAGLAAALAAPRARGMELVKDILNPPRTALAFAQTPDGMMWIGSLDDVQSFDGTDLTSVRASSETGPQKAWAVRLAATADGALWMGRGGSLIHSARDGTIEFELRSSGGLQRLVGGAAHPVGAAQGLMNDMVWALLPARRGGLWVGTEQGLAHVERARVRMWGPREGLSGAFVLSLAEAPSGTLLVGTTRGLFFLRGDQVTGPVMPDEPITALANFGEASAGTFSVWVGTPLGLRRLTGLSDGAQPPRIPVGQGGFPGGEIHALVAARDGSLWVGSGRGLFHLQDAHAANPTSADWQKFALSDDRVVALFEDEDRQLWVGTRGGGVNKLAPRRVWNYGDAEGLVGEPMAVAVAPGGRVWAATARGLFHFAAGRFHSAGWDVPQGTFIPQGLDIDAQGRLWLATPSGLLRAVPKTKTSVTSAQDLVLDAPPVLDGLQGPARSVRVTEHEVIVALEDGGLARTPLDESGEPQIARTVQLRRADGLCPGIAVSLAVDASPGREGSLWAAVPGGGITFVDRQQRARCYAATLGVTHLDVHAVAVDRQGRVFAGAINDHGIFILRGDRFINMTSAQGLFCDSIYEIVPAGDDDLWLACAGGSAWLRRSHVEEESGKPYPAISSIGFGGPDGPTPGRTSQTSHPAAATDRQGALWVATRTAISRMALPTATPSRGHPVRLTGLQTGARTIAWPEAAPDRVSLTALPGGTPITLEFRIPSLVSPSHITIACEVKGRPETRTFFNGRPHLAALPALPPGEHVVELRATDGEGGFQAEATRVILAISWPWYRRWQVQATGGLGIPLLLWLGHSMRMRRLQRRFASVQGERARIARDLHDSLGQTFASLGMHIDAASRISSGAPEQLRTVLDQARAITGQAREDTRRAIWELRADGIDAPPLDQALEALVRRMRVPSGPHIDLLIRGPALPRSAFVEYELLRIAEEAVANSVRHGGARAVSVQLENQGTHATLAVTDDGCGIPENAASLSAAGHFGIVGLMERAERLGAKLEIRRRGANEPGITGSLVRLTIPIERWSQGKP